MTSADADRIARRNQRTGLIVLAIVIGMVALSFAAVPLYRLFCQATGIGGPAQIMSVAAAPSADKVRARQVEIRFNADVDQKLPWGFRPLDRAVTLNIGQEGMTAFEAVNQGNQPVVGTAVYNVLPEKAGKYFHKTQCFCFGEQRLEPGQDVQMPVIFYVDPAFDDDPNMQGVESITLSYTFYRTESAELDRAIERYQQP